MQKHFFDVRNPRIDLNSYTSKPAVVLQVMLCGGEQLLAEVMWKEDFDKMFGGVEG